MHEQQAVCVSHPHAAWRGVVWCGVCPVQVRACRCECMRGSVLPCVPPYLAEVEGDEGGLQQHSTVAHRAQCEGLVPTV